MDKLKRHTVISAIVLALVVAVWYAFINGGTLNEDILETEKVSAVHIDSIIEDFKSDETLASEQYIDKVIQIEGIITKISYLNERHTLLLKSNSFEKSFVICDMSPTEVNNIKAFHIGDTISLRGVCKGFLLDVIMLNCITVNEKFEI